MKKISVLIFLVTACILMVLASDDSRYEKIALIQRATYELDSLKKVMNTLENQIQSHENNMMILKHKDVWDNLDSRWWNQLSWELDTLSNKFTETSLKYNKKKMEFNGKFQNESDTLSSSEPTYIRLKISKNEN